MQGGTVILRASQTVPELPWWLAFGIIATVYVLMRVNAVDIPLDRDEGVFGYAGQRILEGGLPYKDVVDHKPPGVFYLYALALSLVSPTPKGLHLFLQTYNFLTLLAVWFLMRCRFHSGWPPFWGAFCYGVFSASPNVQGFTGSTEMLMLLPLVVSLVLAVESSKRPVPWLFLAGGFVGAMAFWIKQTAITSIGFIGLYLAATAWKTRTRGAVRWQLEAARRLFWWGVGAAVMSGAIAAYFRATGLFHEFVYWSFTHNFLYARQLSLSESLSEWAQTLGTVMRGDFAVVGLGVAAAIYHLRDRKEDGVFALGFILFSLVGTLPGLAYGHYFAQLAPSVAMASGWGVAMVFESGAFQSRLAIAAGACILVLIPAWMDRDYFFESTPNLISRRYFGLSPFPESAELSQYVASHTSPRDKVFIFGSEPQILLRAKRKSASPFVMIYPLTAEYPRYRQFQEMVWQDIVDNSPAYILVVNIPSSVLWDGRADLNIENRLEKLIRSRYELEAVMPIRLPEGHLIIMDKGQAPVSNDDSILVYHLNEHPKLS